MQSVENPPHIMGLWLSHSAWVSPLQSKASHPSHALCSTPWSLLSPSPVTPVTSRALPEVRGWRQHRLLQLWAQPGFREWQMMSSALFSLTFPDLVSWKGQLLCKTPRTYQNVVAGSCFLRYFGTCFYLNTSEQARSEKQPAHPCRLDKAPSLGAGMTLSSQSIPVPNQETKQGANPSVTASLKEGLLINEYITFCSSAWLHLLLWKILLFSMIIIILFLSVITLSLQINNHNLKAPSSTGWQGLAVSASGR